MRGKRDLNQEAINISQLILLIALVHGGKPNARFNWIFFIPILIIFVYSAFFCASDDVTADFKNIHFFAVLLFVASDYILLRNHQPELRKIGQKKPTSEMALKERFVWAASLLANFRGIGWAHEPTDHIPPRPTSSRARFIASQLLWTVFYFILFDFTSIIVREHPCFRTGGPSLAAFGWLWRTTSWLGVLRIYYTFCGLYAISTIVSVVTGLCKPADCPHIFGSPLDAYTLRNCWGRVWHQMFRKLLTSNANFLAKTLRLPKGTFTTYFKLFTTFFISALIHSAGDYAALHDFSKVGSMRFFLLQAVGITFEDAVIAAASRLGYKKSDAFFKLVGFAWVFAWFTFSLPIWLDPQIHVGATGEGINVSLILGLTRGEWRTKPGYSLWLGQQEDIYRSS